MRVYLFEEMKPTKGIHARVYLETLSFVEGKKRVGKADPVLEEVITAGCLNNWKRLFRTGRVLSLGPREWFMVWED